MLIRKVVENTSIRNIGEVVGNISSWLIGKFVDNVFG
jgi:hypothetical protein